MSLIKKRIIIANEQGYKARFIEKPMSDNPYTSSPVEHAEWQRGWISADSQISSEKATRSFAKQPRR